MQQMPPMGAIVAMKNTFVTAILMSVAAVAPSAMAQTAPPISRTIPLTFTGVVTNDVTNSIKIRQPDGSFAPYTGPVPDYPYKVGDPVTISFNATVPTQAFYAPGGPYGGQVAADGIYRLNVGGQAGFGSGFIPGPGGVGAISNPDVTGPISPNANTRATGVNMTIVYDSNADTYSLAYPNGGWSMYDLNAPSYTFDPATGTLSGGAVACPGGVALGCNDNNPGGFTFVGTENSATGKNIGIYTPASNTPTSYIAGVFDLVFGGSWNLPTYGGGGGSTSVPEPSMMFLFGGGAAALLRRRRQKKAA
jgi:PEP-CTERM motif